jgi:hypothetical protein
MPKQEVKVEGPKSVTFYLIDTETNTVVATGNPLSFPLKRGLILARHAKGAGVELLLNLTNMSEEEALELASKIVREVRAKMGEEEEEDPVNRFFEIQGNVDRFAYYVKIMRAFLAAYADDKKLVNGVFWDEVERFYKSLKEDVEAISARVHEIRQLLQRGGGE